MKVVVIGNGTWGTALACTLIYNKVETTLLVRDKEYYQELKKTRINSKYFPDYKLPKELNYTMDLKASLLSADIIVSSVPTKYIRELFEKIKGFGLAKLPLFVNTSKGIENKSLKLIHQIFQEYFPDIQSGYVTLSGPSHAEEVIKQLPTTVVVSSKNINDSELVQSLFSNTEFFRCYTNKDLVGVECGGALKNIFAIAAGVIDGLQLGVNAQAALITRGLGEIIKLGNTLGADERTFNGLSGVGDLVVTCMSNFSRNRTLGRLLVKGLSIEEIREKMGHSIAEGYYTVKSAYDLSKKKSINTPLIDAFYFVVYQQKGIKSVVKNLMKRDIKQELDIK